MAGTYLRRPLSGSTDGRGILIAAVATAGTTVHTAQASATLVDVLTLYAYNANTTVETVTVEWGNASTTDNIVTNVLPTGSGGLTPIVVDLVIRNSLVVKVFSTTTNKVSIFGFMNTES